MLRLTPIQVVMGMLRCQNLNIEIYVQLKLFWRNDNFTPTVLSQLEGISCYQSTSTRSTSYGPEIVMEQNSETYNNSLCITNIDLTNGVTVHWGCQGNNPGYSLWSLTLLVFKRMNE